MNTNVSTDLITATPATSKVLPPETTDQPNSAPDRSLESLAQAIRSDASSDSLKYVLRSDTGQDGE